MGNNRFVYLWLIKKPAYNLQCIHHMFITDVYQDKNPISGRILVLDSDSTICDMIRSHFGPDGFAVDSCSESDDFYSIDVNNYNLIIIDLNIDDGMGLGIVEQIKQSRETASVGVITCSVNMSPTTIINALNAGADDYILKPFSLRELMARVRSVLRRQHR